MITLRHLIALAVATTFPLLATAQSEFKFSFQGVCYETNSAGKVTTRRVTDRTLLKDIAQDAGDLDFSGWTLAYHVGGSSFGDTVDVVDSSNGHVLDTYFGLYFGEDSSLGRIALKGSRDEKRIDYVYTKQNSHSMGAALVTKRKMSGGTQFISASGQIQWILAPMGSKGIRVYSGTFRTGPPLPGASN